MYVRREPRFESKDFPQNYNGSLRQTSDNSEEICENKDRHVNRYTVKKNKSIIHRPKDVCDNVGNTDDLVLIGALAFLYIGCEHTKENLILMAILAYLLFICKKD